MLRFASLLICALLLASSAQAYQAPEPVHAAAKDFLELQTRGLPGKVTISITPLSAENRLAPCSALDAFLPGGARAWGRTMVGVRCISGANWSVYLRAHVEVEGTYLTTARFIRAGDLVQDQDLTLQEGDLTQLPAGILTSAEQAHGRIAAFNIGAAQPLRNDMLRNPPAVLRGQTVMVVFSGAGFQVATEGVALGDAVLGQVVQVKLTSGQVRSGLAKAGGVVELNR